MSSLKYVTVDKVVESLLSLGKGSLMAKMDIKQAYRNVPVCPTDRILLGMSWKGRVYIDKTLPFGLRSAPLLFSAIADALAWIMKMEGASIVFNYIDDYITLGKPNSTECQINLSRMTETCNKAGFPVEESKSLGPVTCIPFLGLELDSVKLQIRLPQEKLDRLLDLLAAWRGRKACRKRELLSLVGSLSHACKAVRSGRAFLRRLIDLSTTAKHLDHFVRLNADARSDIEWWFKFAGSWNGITMMQAIIRSAPSTTLTSDASGNWGCGAFAGRSWFNLRWADQLLEHNITRKELVPIVVAAAIWGEKWRGSTVQVLCDNSAVVSIVNSNTSRDKEVMHLLRCLAFISARFQFILVATHLPGQLNAAADALSRNRVDVFRAIMPQAEELPTEIPTTLLELLLFKKPDWTSWNWTELWSDTFKAV